VSQHFAFDHSFDTPCRTSNLPKEVRACSNKQLASLVDGRKDGVYH